MFCSVARADESNPSKVLNFRPHTMSVKANLHLPPRQRAFDSYMLRTYQRIAKVDQIDEKEPGTGSLA